MFVGANASGKSNFFDALRVLQGLAHGFTIDEVLNGKPRSATRESWEPIRGGSANAWFRGGDSQTIAIEVGVPLRWKATTVSFAVSFDPVRGRVVQETLSGSGSPFYDTDVVDNSSGRPTIRAMLYERAEGRHAQPEFERSRPILHQIMLGPDSPNEWLPILQ